MCLCVKVGQVSNRGTERNSLPPNSVDLIISVEFLFATRIVLNILTEGVEGDLYEIKGSRNHIALTVLNELEWMGSFKGIRIISAFNTGCGGNTLNSCIFFAFKV